MKKEYSEHYEEFLKIVNPEDYREFMIKQKEDYDKMKEREGDSDLIFNEKDNKETE